MCGIAGILRIQARSDSRSPTNTCIPESWLDALDASIRHRGPDGQGRFRDQTITPDGRVAEVAFVHRRMSIIDLDGGRQPMISRGRSPTSESLNPPSLFHGRPNDTVEYQRLAHTRSDRLAVVFNGCIYNHRDLRRELTSAGHTFETSHSDTEVLVHGWREWGAGNTDNATRTSRGLFSRLDGMFALAIWDGRVGTVTLARDAFGEKPLYVMEAVQETETVFAFCSSIPGLARLARMLANTPPKQPLGPDWVRFGSARGAGEFTEVSPSTTVTLGTPSMRDAVAPYETEHGSPESFDLHRAAAVRSRTLTVQDTDSLLRSAVESRLETDVPLGCFLSGGIDSSLMAQYAIRSLGSLRTFTVAMPDAAYDESAIAERVARQLGATHTTLPCHAHPAQDLCDLIERIGLPLGDSSLLPTYWVSRATREHVSVALSGDGGDELFAGYDRYSVAPMLARWSRVLSALPAAAFGAHNPKSRSSKARRLILAARGNGYKDLLSIFPSELARSLGMPDTAGHGSSPALPRDAAIAQAIDDDLRTYLPNSLLRKSDTASMHIALEVRAPMLASHLSAAARTASIASLMPARERKGLLRAVARQYFPADVVDRPKMGFAVPIGDWFRTDYGGMKTLLMDMLQSPDAFPPDLIGFEVNRQFVERMRSQHMSGERDHGQRLYCLLVLAIWARWRRSA